MFECSYVHLFTACRATCMFGCMFKRRCNFGMNGTGADLHHHSGTHRQPHDEIWIGLKCRLYMLHGRQAMFEGLCDCKTQSVCGSVVRGGQLNIVYWIAHGP